MSDDWYTFSNSWSYLPSINWLFDVTENPTSWGDYKISSARLNDWMQSYSENRDKDVLGQFNSGLFEGGCLDHFQDKITSENFIMDLSEKDRPWYEFWKPTEYDPISPIHCLTEAEMQYIMALDASKAEDVAAFESTYFVENDNTGSSSQSVLKDFQAMISANTVPVIFRFADSEYYATNACFDNFSSTTDYVTATNGYVAQESVFLNFDIISLGFQTQEGGNALEVIPVVADPINVIPSLIAPENIPIEEEEWWQKIVALLLLILIVVLLMPFLSPLFMIFFDILWRGIKLFFELIIFLITLPFKLLWRLLFGR